MTKEKPSQAGRIALGALSAVLIALAGFFFLPPPAPMTQTPVPVMQSDAPVAPTVETAPQVADQAPVLPAPQGPAGPTFDTFRLEPDGTMLIAGRAAANEDVDVILGDEAIARATADVGGSFVIFAVAPPATVPRRLSLLGDPDGAAVASETSYMVAPFGVVETAAAPPPASTAPAPQAAEPVSPQPPAMPAPPPTASAALDIPATPTVLQADAEGIRVVQTAPQLVPNVALDAITYDPEGEVLLSGRATGDGAIQVYLDNRPVTSSPVNEGGDWRTDLPDVDTGIYTLRIDEVDSEGTVVSRIETPFKREQASDVAAVLAEETAREGFQVAVRTVQPGATLWAIAEENLGKGIYYVEVFEANRDLIKDPDLIYPGQIFRIPEAPE